MGVKVGRVGVLFEGLWNEALVPWIMPLGDTCGGGPFGRSCLSDIVLAMTGMPSGCCCCWPIANI